MDLSNNKRDSSEIVYEHITTRYCKHLRIRRNARVQTTHTCRDCDRRRYAEQQFEKSVHLTQGSRILKIECVERGEQGFDCGKEIGTFDLNGTVVNDHEAFLKGVPHSA